MVVPNHIKDAARRGDVTTVREWLDTDAAHDVNDFDGFGVGLLEYAGGCLNLQRGNAMIAFLLARGVDVNQERRGSSMSYKTLHNACYWASFGAVKLLVSHGADVNLLSRDAVSDSIQHSPLSIVAGSLDHNMSIGGGDVVRLRHKANLTGRTLTTLCRDTYDCIVFLLRAGASLDGPAAGGTRPEVILERRIGDIPAPSHPDFLPKMELKLALDRLKAVRAAGGWRKWTLVPPKKLLRLRSLIARGRARAPRRNPSWRRDMGTALAWLMSPNVPNEIAWRVLAYWNPRH